MPLSTLFRGTSTIVAVSICLSSHAHARSGANNKPLSFQNDLVTVRYDRQSGTMDVLWRDGHKLLGISSAAQLEDGRTLSSTTYTAHESVPETSVTAGAHEYTIRSSSPGTPALSQHIWLYDGQPWIAVEAELDPEGAKTGTRHFDAVVAKGNSPVQIKEGAALRFLQVPFDNDMWFRYDSISVAEMKAGERSSSNEVTAIYDNTSRQGIVLGSITHDVWKTAIEVHAADSQLTGLDIYGGIASPTGVRTDTHDTVPHGLVHGDHVLSPRILIGSFADWRDGLEAYGKANAAIRPPLAWPAGAPMGWNSWAAYGTQIDYQRYLGAAAFVRDTLVPQGFGRNGVVYINLDAFWSKLDAVQLADAVADVKAMRGADGIHFEPGIYWTPFAYWSDDLDTYVEGVGMKYRYRDILLKAPDGSLLPKVDGGRPIDPSHPGTKERTAYFLAKFKQMGFAYLKLDFLSHGALEGAHYDPAVQTGIEAYNLGMKQITDENANQMFLSLSIAPLFPSGYGHARRLSCDTKGHIGGGDQSTEYMLNSLTYGWWTDKNLYITDPDHVVLGGKADLGARSVVEGKSRLLSAVISGGMILDSSRLADDSQGQALAKSVYDNRAIFAVASEGKVFRPIEGDTGNKAATAFVRPSASGFYLAVFNYSDKEPQTIRIPLERISPELAHVLVTTTDVASGAKLGIISGELTIELQPAESKLLLVTAELTSR
jgi:alpha-galactosidase